MAEERTLGLARAQEQTAEEPSKQELQRRLDVARDSISHTVTEIKESVANQVQAVKDTLDWREQFKRRPVVWSAGAVGFGFLVGYGLAAIVKGDGEDYEEDRDRYYGSAGYNVERYADEAKSYAAQPVLGAAAASASDVTKQSNGKEDEGPGIFERLSHTHAYQKVKDEAANLGEAVVQEISKTAKQVVLPALMTSLRNFIGGYLPSTGTGASRGTAASTGTGSSTGTGASQPSGSSANMRGESDRGRSGAGSTYQPTLEHQS